MLKSTKQFGSTVHDKLKLLVILLVHKFMQIHNFRDSNVVLASKSLPRTLVLI